MLTCVRALQHLSTSGCWFSVDFVSATCLLKAFDDVMFGDVIHCSKRSQTTWRCPVNNTQYSLICKQLAVSLNNTYKYIYIYVYIYKSCFSLTLFYFGKFQLHVGVLDKQLRVNTYNKTNTCVRQHQQARVDM